MWRYQFVFCLLVPVWGLYEGSSCHNKDGFPGVCKTLNDCPVGISMLQGLKYHDLDRCGFKGFDEIVCCPDDVNVETTTAVAETRAQSRKSVVACEGFMSKSLPRIGHFIVHGTDTKEGEFPHMAALGYVNEEGTKWGCGGTLIAPKFVLTAAHCIHNADQILPTKIRMGTIDLTNENDPNKQDFEVEDFKVHPEFKRIGRKNDIAILRLKNEVKFKEHIQPACLWTNQESPKNFTITGWGDTTGFKKLSLNSLQKATTYVSDMDKCRDIFRKRINKEITDSQICAEDPNIVNTTDTCQGDSGGPLQIVNPNDDNLFSIVGVTSYGMGCGENYPSVYTRVSAYLDFIENYVWPD